MSIRLLTLVVLALGFGSACDVFVPWRGMLTLAMGERIVGGQGNDVSPGRPAVFVDAEGQLQVIAADLRGGDLLVSRPGNTFPGPGIRGLVASVTVTGGSITGGSVRFVDGAQGTYRGGSGVELLHSFLMVTGGQIRGGDAPSPGSRGNGVDARNGSRVFVSGGDIDSIAVAEASAFLRGGRIGTLSVVPLEGFPPPGGPSRGCIFLGGGQIRGPISLNVGTLFIAGSSFNLRFGEVPPASPGAIEQLPLRGVLADGSAIDVVIQRQGGRLVLVGPNELASSFCPAGAPL
jgi:hypothetical protein